MTLDRSNLLTFECLQQELDVVLVVMVLLGEPAVGIEGQPLHGDLHLPQHHLLLSGVKLELFTTQTQPALLLAKTNHLGRLKKRNAYNHKDVGCTFLFTLAPGEKNPR